MKKREIAIFIEEMEEIGDIWTPEEVKEAYGDSTLGEALADRKAALGIYFDIIEKVINNN